MLLRYPTVRLALATRLLERGNCAAAFSEIARECGLNCPEDLSVVQNAVHLGACGSLTTARLVLEANAPLLANQLYERLVSAVEDYKLEKNQKHCRGINLEPAALDCTGMAPVVMDLLLQLLESQRGR